MLPPTEDSFEDLLGALGDDVYPPGYLEELRAEWDERCPTPRSGQQ